MDFDQILKEVPESLKALTENHQNLINVAQYCTENYLQTCGGPEALDLTRSLLNQSLASVAFQISSVSQSLLRLLDLQSLDLDRLQSSVLLLHQSVDMHREKVSRRDIGVFTVGRRVPRCHKLLPPAQVKPRPPYSRQPINFKQLDTVGHGVKVGVERTGTLRKLGSSSSFRFNSNKTQTTPQEPVQCPTAPPTGSFGRPVAPPSIPSSWQPPPAVDEPLPLSDVTDEAPPPAPEPNNEIPFDPLIPPPPPPPPTSNSPSAGETLDLIGSSEAVVLPPPPPPPPETPPTLPAPPPPPPLLETVVEEVSFPPPPDNNDDFTQAAPPFHEDETLPPPPPSFTEENDSYDLEIPPPPPLLQDQD